MKQSYRKEMQEAKADKSDGKREGQGNRLGGPKLREGHRGPRFQQYTQLDAPWARILQEALSTQLIQMS